MGPVLRMSSANCGPQCMSPTKPALPDLFVTNPKQNHHASPSVVGLIQRSYPVVGHAELGMAHQACGGTGYRHISNHFSLINKLLNYTVILVRSPVNS